MKVIVKPHNRAWSRMYVAVSKEIMPALSDNAVHCHHIGSTSIPTIYAKPIIDVLVEVLDIAGVDLRDSEMKAIGFEPMGEYGIPGRRYFRRNNEQGVRTHHVHVFASSSPEVVRHLAFRDYLIAHPKVAQQYSNLKRQLASAHPEDMEAYMDGKDAFIKDAVRQAVAWKGAT